MKVFNIESRVRLDVPLEPLFSFFSDAKNLEILTPPWLRFEVLTPSPVHMQAGTLIDYRLRLRGIPLRWQSQITAWEPPYRFVDEQCRGPYRLWVHEHTFQSGEAGTLATDSVEYAVLGGEIVNRLLVAPDLSRIFRYRRRKLLELFGKASSSRPGQAAS